MHILVVEDDPLSRKALLRILAEAGHTTCWAQNAKGAFRHLKHENVEAVLLDIDLGHESLSGFDIARTMHQTEDWEKIPIIIVSGLDAEDIREEVRPKKNPLEGVGFIVSKPVEKAVLLRILDGLKGEEEP